MEAHDQPKRSRPENLRTSAPPGETADPRPPSDFARYSAGRLPTGSVIPLATFRMLDKHSSVGAA